MTETGSILCRTDPLVQVAGPTLVRDLIFESAASSSSHCWADWPIVLMARCLSIMRSGGASQPLAFWASGVR